jgi:hypothetical protein
MDVYDEPAACVLGISQHDNSPILEKEAMGSSETSRQRYKTSKRQNAQDLNLDNLRSWKRLKVDYMHSAWGREVAASRGEAAHQAIIKGRSTTCIGVTVRENGM